MISNDPRLPQLPYTITQETVSSSFWRQFSQRFYELWRELVSLLTEQKQTLDGKITGISASVDGQVVRFSGDTGALSSGSTLYVLDDTPFVNQVTVRVTGSGEDGNFAVRTELSDGVDRLVGGYLFDGYKSTATADEQFIAAMYGQTEGTSAQKRGGRIQFHTKGDGTAATLDERMRIDASGNVVVNTAAIATNATNGFLYVPSCAGTPTGTPTTYTGRVPIVVDTTNHKMYFYSGGQWRDAGP